LILSAEWRFLISRKNLRRNSRVFLLGSIGLAGFGNIFPIHESGEGKNCFA